MRGLLRDCENFADGLFAALVTNIVTQTNKNIPGGHARPVLHVQPPPQLLGSVKLYGAGVVAQEPSLQPHHVSITMYY